MWEIAQGVCPAGWYLPFESEANEMLESLNKEDFALKFAPKATGFRKGDGVFSFGPEYGYFWTRSSSRYWYWIKATNSIKWLNVRNHRHSRRVALRTEIVDVGLSC